MEKNVNEVLNPIKKKGLFQKLTSYNQEQDVLISAHDAYLRTTYSDAETDAVRMQNFLQKSSEIMLLSRQHKEFGCTIQIPDDLLLYTEDVINKFESLGYRVVNLKKELKDIEYTYLFISWDFNTFSNNKEK